MDFTDTLLKAREGMHAKFAEAISEAGENFNGENLAAQIAKMLTEERREIVLRIMGLTESWGRLELVTKGSQHGRGLVGEFIDEHAKQAAQSWMDGELRPLFEEASKKALSSKAVRKAIMDDYARAYEYEYRERARMLAKKAAQEHAKELHDEAMRIISLKENPDEL